MPNKVIEKIKEFDKFGSVLGLERMEKLMELLGNPQDSLKYIHVAGTNGKGSVCRYIYNALISNGYNVGLFTSPFLEIFNERIEMNGSYISDEELEICTEEVLAKSEEMVKNGANSPTEFEIVTAIAFVYFKRKQVDFVVLEVGLGGKGDSTNIIKKPEISIITSISYDHMDRLGNTLAEIAAEKAGIIKPGVPVVINVEDREAQVPIARKAYENDCVLHDVTKIPYSISNKSIGRYSVDLNIYGTDYSGISISMEGKHQVKNLITAVTALELLRRDKKIKVERDKLYEGILKTVHKGRFEHIGEKIVLDGAHNVAGARALAETVDELYPGKRIMALVGILEDKEYRGILAEFSNIADFIILTEVDNPRKCDAKKLCIALRDIMKKNRKLSDEEIESKTFFEADRKKALNLALSKIEEFDILLIAGSLYLIGELRPLILKKNS